MTLQSEDMGKLVAGPLETQDLSKLTPASVLMVRSYGDQMKLATFIRPSGSDGSVHDRPVIVVDEDGQTAPNCWGVHRFSYVGERTPDGWIEGEWAKNPVPGMDIETRWSNGEEGPTCASEIVSWRRGGVQISAFRPAHREAQPETDGGGEAVTCQSCGGELQGWTCQGCGQTFRENDAGVLVCDTPEGQTEGAEPVSSPYKFASEIVWLREAARYFSRRPTGGEDSAHWANVMNADNASKLADRLAALASKGV